MIRVSISTMSMCRQILFGFLKHGCKLLSQVRWVIIKILNSINGLDTMSIKTLTTESLVSWQFKRDQEVLKCPAEEYASGWWAICKVMRSQDIMRRVSQDAYTPQYKHYEHNRVQP
jgi:hypothetical protein